MKKYRVSLGDGKSEVVEAEYAYADAGGLTLSDVCNKPVAIYPTGNWTNVKVEKESAADCNSCGFGIPGCNCGVPVDAVAVTSSLDYEQAESGRE